MRRRWIWLALGVLLAASLSYLLRDLINEKVVVPLAYAWWRLGLYYRLVPEDVWWTTVIVIIFFVVLQAFNTDEWSRSRDEVESQPVQGPVEEMMAWLGRAPDGAYYRWLVANYLAKLARGFLIQTDGRDERQWDVLYGGPAWDPPEVVEDYLRTGLNRPSASFRSPGGLRASPINLNPEKAVEYLESQMENHGDGNQ